MGINDRRSYNNAALPAQLVNGLKKKAVKVTNVQIKVGSTKVELPAEAFLLTTDSGHAFLSLQPINAVLQKSDRGYEAVIPKLAEEAVSALKKHRARGNKATHRGAPVPLDPELQKVLSKIPKGYKLVSKESGYVMVKARTRTKK